MPPTGTRHRFTFKTKRKRAGVMGVSGVYGGRWGAWGRATHVDGVLHVWRRCVPAPGTRSRSWRREVWPCSTLSLDPHFHLTAARLLYVF
jgi:hypothetical protein